MKLFVTPGVRVVTVVALAVTVLALIVKPGPIALAWWIAAGLLGASINVHGRRYTEEEIRVIVRDELARANPERNQPEE